VLLAAKKYQDAYDELQQARAIDANFAEVLYRLGQACVGLGKKDEAARYFEAAKENDGFSYRALNVQWEAMRDAGARYNVPVIDCRQLIKAVSPTGLLDDNVFHDIHHPTIAGYNAMAKEMTKIILDRKMIRPGEAKMPEFETDNQILEDFQFSSNDWLKMYISRVYHFEQLSKVLSDPTDRLKEIIRQLEIMKIINKDFYENYINVNGFEKGLLQRLEQAMLPWNEKLEDFDKLELYNKLKSYITLKDLAPIVISGVPSQFRHSKVEVTAGIFDDYSSITVLGKVYKDSFFMQPAEKYPGVVYYQLDGKYRTFSCRLGVEDHSKPEATVRNEIIGDGKVLYSSPVMKKDMPLIDVRVNITGVHELHLVTHLVGEDIDANYAVWIGSRFE
jgi:tetratricopeptide (TPR) repeat protein